MFLCVGLLLNGFALLFVLLLKLLDRLLQLLLQFKLLYILALPVKRFVGRLVRAIEQRSHTLQLLVEL